MDGEVSNVKVCVRCRPLSKKEIEHNEQIAVSFNKIEKSITVKNVDNSEVYFIKHLNL